jgi:hypothetical protein
MKPQTLSAFIAIALLPLVGAKCTGFNFTDTTHGNDGWTTTYNTTFPVTNTVKCTAELAASDRSSGNSNNNRTCAVHRYAAGLVLHPEVRLIAADNTSAERIYALVRRGASAKAAASTNFNTTVVANYTAMETGIHVSQMGYIGFTPYIRCFEGTLSGCTDEDGDGNAQFDGKGVTVCGLDWLRDDQAVLEPGKQLYNGIEGIVQTSTVSGQQEPQPRYEDVASLQTFSDDENNGAARNPGVGPRTSVAAALIVGVILYC